jgi:hypothetical protein
MTRQFNDPKEIIVLTTLRRFLPRPRLAGALTPIRLIAATAVTTTRARAFPIAVAVAAIGAMAGPAPAIASERHGLGSTAEVQWTDEAGLRHTARALSSREVRERRLDEYVDMSSYRATTPSIGREDALALAPQKASRNAAAVAAGCWTDSYGSGPPTGWFALFGRTDVTWCGDGKWITYSTSHCTGGEGGYPSYEYLGCQRQEEYGKGWNIYNVWSQWHLCPAWAPELRLPDRQVSVAEEPVQR